MTVMDLNKNQVFAVSVVVAVEKYSSSRQNNVFAFFVYAYIHNIRNRMKQKQKQQKRNDLVAPPCMRIISVHQKVRTKNSRQMCVCVSVEGRGTKGQQKCDTNKKKRADERTNERK